MQSTQKTYSSVFIKLQPKLPFGFGDFNWSWPHICTSGDQILALKKAIYQIPNCVLLKVCFFWTCLESGVCSNLSLISASEKAVKLKYESNAMCTQGLKQSFFQCILFLPFPNKKIPEATAGIFYYLPIPISSMLIASSFQRPDCGVTWIKWAFFWRELKAQLICCWLSH